MGSNLCKPPESYVNVGFGEGQGVRRARAAKEVPEPGEKLAAGDLAREWQVDD
jgi:hypothetical protein